MSVTVEATRVERGDDEFVDAAWNLKEHIRSEEGILRQRRRFFENAYRRSTTYLYYDGGHDPDLIGFAAVRRDGYILFLAVDPAYRNEGFGKRLIARAVGDYESVSCHARTTNQSAMQFYRHIGFEVERRIDNYYEDGGDAYYLTLGNDDGIIDRLQGLLTR
ncbi:MULTISPECIES: N-acetyltransferase [unclassified Halorhabdus]|uniref:GNAT family N-acetyltransferase n=1 Tax=unclassified Halorhabdus TaxID=2621901 RepID=UPI0023DA1281|nr:MULTISPECIES: N-acetyltransferase [unclassified Halorhabdus]WEL17988.1 Acetyltransferase (GNAT) family [Halorhabdus sp. SVX81]WEL21870.1 Acetyltransferase (GNAT) family [Halorhabdus sp. BNX81]